MKSKPPATRGLLGMTRTVLCILLLLLVSMSGSAVLYPADARSEAGGQVSPKLPPPEGRTQDVPPLTGAFTVRKGLRPAVEFWKGIFGIYRSDQALVHHARRLDIVYSVLDFSDLRNNPGARHIRRGRQRSEVRRVQAMLRRLRKTSSPAQLSEKELRIYKLLKGARGGFTEAAREENIHVQSGISDRFRKGLIVSRRYLPEIEAIFREAGLPPQLTRMPFVESTFNVEVRSKAGASGLWQFIPSTGRLYMKVGRAVDERRDPIFATHAATKLLRYNYSVIHSWPLAVTAYNHGLGGVQRAVRITGSRDIVQIIKRYRGRRFGYASRNFFVELLAALEVERSYARYFGDLDFAAPFSYDEIKLNRPILAKNLARAGMSRTEIADLNPSLSSRTLSGTYAIPAGMKLRTPPGRGERVVAKLNALSARDLPSARTSARRHRVRRGESLTSVARRHGVSRFALARANGLSSRAHLQIGQRLKVPGGQRASRVASTSYSKTGRRAVFVRRVDPARTYRGGDWTRPPDTRVAGNSFDAAGLVLGEGTPPPAQPAAGKHASPPAKSAPPVSSAAPGNKPGSSPGAVTGSSPAKVVETPAVPKKSKRKATAASKKKTRSATHIVRRNESLWLIAKKYKTTVTKLRQANSEKRLRPLLPGTRLRVPATGTTHVVRRNETLWGIARRYRVSLSHLRQANRGKRLTPLRPGTRLRIPG